MFEDAMNMIKATEATEDDLNSQLSYFDILPSQVVDVLSVAIERANGGVTDTIFSMEWVVGSNYQEEMWVEDGDLIPGDTISIRGRFQYWEFCRKNPNGEVIAFIRLRCNQVRDLIKIQRFV